MKGLLLAALLAVPTAAQSPLAVQGDHFVLRGKPFQILSGELEYVRIPRVDWADRLRKVHALGLNTVTVYVFWNVHERTPGSFDFSGQNDVAAFVRAAQAEGLNVVLRPGPYVCAEWDLGGYPAWLLQDPTMLLRSSQPAYQQAARRWMLRLGQELAPLQASRGGPIIAVQVENEYGSFQVPDDGGAYMRAARQMVVDAGFGESLLYTADGADVEAKGSLPGLLAGVDFGTGDAARSIDLLKKFRPGAPVYLAEYWDGWFDHWGEKHQTADAAVEEREIRSAIEQGYSISLYMAHGGTSFGWYNGANSDQDHYQPDVSSYDYDAPLDESGRPRPKYDTLRRAIAEATHRQPLPVPASTALVALAPITLTHSRSLWDSLPTAVEAEKPATMEALGQSFGYLLYRTTVPAESNGTQTLTLGGLHSYARVYVDGTLAGVVDRRLGQERLQVTVRPRQRLDVLVENSGRINFTTKIRGERAGILGEVALGAHVLNGWQMYPLPLEQAPGSGYAQRACAGPCFYTGELTLDTPGDTYLDTATLGKGVVWVNGHLLGRFWNVGPVATLYLPGAWLHAGANRVQVLDLNGGASVSMTPVAAQHYVEPRVEVAR